MRRTLRVRGLGLGLTGRTQAARQQTTPPSGTATVLVTELGERLVDELGNALAIKEIVS